MNKSKNFLAILFLLIFFNNAGAQNFDYNIKLKEEFVISMSSNPSTGQQWTWVNKDSAKIIELVNRKYVSKKPVKPGTGGMMYWTFKGVKTGTVDIILRYSRPGQLNRDRSHLRVIHIKVRESTDVD